jgi:hypothetical protein
MSTHRRPHGHEQRKRGEAVEIARQIHITIEHEVSEIVRTAVNIAHREALLDGTKALASALERAAGNGVDISRN